MDGGSVAVVGAGVFGAATARELSRRGYDVTLVEQYSPGNIRSGSGGDTRLLRFSHGEDEWYTRSARRSLGAWRELEAETGERLFEPVGVAWFDDGDSAFVAESERTLSRLGIPAERVDGQTLFPSVEVASVLFEPEAGVLRARRATQALARGLRLETRRASPDDPPRADVVVWACGSWLAALFPALVQQKVTRRDVFFFGGDGDWTGCPGWCDYDGAFYGTGDLGGLGVKVAPDTAGDEVEPDTLERMPQQETARLAREYAARRFPSLADAPIVAARVCQYDLTPDAHFLVAPHPEHANWWLVGGGSGHGFKHGPALGEYVADCVEGKRLPEPFHALGPRKAGAGLRTATVEI
ncbi:MAG: FAD-dependent oxidoreductase [Actinobacteria bacterium]|nr:FAD-dependent oxidoreductase [Actinomycetota bacterium]MBV8598696.1 FAD-dependent oxidoreductase [Actinomycetota bacterium]